MQHAAQLDQGVLLSELAPDARIARGGDVPVRGCCDDPRFCRPGDLFVLCEDQRGDGDARAAEAVRRGAAAVLAERYLLLDAPVSLVRDAREAFGRICHRLAGDPSARMRVVGVAGAAGKTTVAGLVASVLEAAGRRVGVVSDLGRSDSVDFAPAAGDARPPEFAHWMERMVRQGCEDCVIEASRVGVARRRLAGLAWDALVLTGFGAGRLGRRWDAALVRRLVEQLKPGGFVVLNADDPRAARWLEKLDRPAITIGRRSAAEVTAELLEEAPWEQTFLLTAGADAIAVRTRVAGRRHVDRCLAAAAVGLVFGLDLPAIARGLEAVERLPGRLERIECGQPFSVFVDYASTPAEVGAALDALRPTVRGRLLCVFSAGGQAAAALRPQLGRAVERRADLGVVTTDRRAPRSARLAAVHEVLDGCRRPQRLHPIPDRDRALAWVLAQAEPGDVVLAAGLDRRLEHAFGDRPGVVDDRDVIRRWLYRAAALEEAGRRTTESPQGGGLSIYRPPEPS